MAKYYKKRNRRYRKKRRFKKTKVGQANKVNITKRQTLLPNRFRISLPYGTFRSLNTSLGAIGSQIFRINGIYDPDYTGVGHQPRGYDQIKEMYDHWTVIGFRAQLMFENQVLGVPHIVGAYVSDSTSPLTTVDDILEYGNVVYKKCEGPGDGGSTVTTVNVRVNPNKFMSISNPLDEDDIRGDPTNDPLRQLYLHCFAYSMSGSEGGTVRLQSKLEYVAVFTSPKLPTLS